MKQVLMAVVGTTSLLMVPVFAMAQTVRGMQDLPVPNRNIAAPGYFWEGRSVYSPPNPSLRSDPNEPIGAASGVPGASPTGSWNPTSGTMVNPGR